MSYREHLAEQMETGRRIKQGLPHVEPRWVDEGRIAQRVAKAMAEPACPDCEDTPCAACLEADE